MAYLLGRVTLARLPGVVRSATTLELRTFSLAVGAVVLSLVTFLICALGWLYDAVLVAAIGTALILWYFYGRVQASSPGIQDGGRDQRLDDPYLDGQPSVRRLLPIQTRSRLSMSTMLWGTT